MKKEELIHILNLLPDNIDISVSSIEKKTGEISKTFKTYDPFGLRDFCILSIEKEDYVSYHLLIE